MLGALAAAFAPAYQAYLLQADARALHAAGVASLAAFVISGFVWLAPPLLP